MSSVAEQLRSEREVQKLTHADIVKQTNLMTDQIIALEEGRWDYFAAPVYARGFLRTYAQLLKLPAADLVNQMENECDETKEATEIGDPSCRRNGILDGVLLIFSRINWKIALPVLVFLALVAGTYFGVKALQDRPKANVSQQLGTHQIDKTPAPIDYDLPVFNP